ATVARLVHAAGSPLLWGWNTADLSEECRALVDLADDLDRGADASKYAKGKRQEALQEAVAAWVESAREGDTNVSFGLACLAAVHVLNRLGAQLGPEHGWPLVDFLHAMALDASACNIDVAGRGSAALAQQLVAGELPLTLSHGFDDFSPL